MQKTTPRLAVDAALSVGTEFILPREQIHYLANVLRLGTGDAVTVFNAVDGEWRAYIVESNRKMVRIRVEKLTTAATLPPDIDLLFAPLKHARLDYLVQKATELGVRRLRPVITARTIAERVNMERMRANATEAAEQCNLVFIPNCDEPVKLTNLLSAWPSDRMIIYADETATHTDPLSALKTATLPAAVLVGPEGGFTVEERQILLSLACVLPVRLGPRIMRADTAATAILTLTQAVLGDWR
jgi:16S rRNA (uracil1498-N3)-methyltransferase